MRPDRPILVSAAEGAELLAGLGVNRHAIALWRQHHRIEPVAKRGRSPLYRFSDLLRVERETRLSGHSHRVGRSRNTPNGEPVQLVAQDRT